MILRAREVTALQHFLMDAARRYVVSNGGTLTAQGDLPAAHGDLLASAAALDYALLLVSEHGDQPFDDAAPDTESLRGTMTRAAIAALDFSDTMLAAPPDVRDDFITRHAGTAGLFDVLRALRRDGAIASDEIGFRAVTLASDLREAQQRG
jgi:hypothetical protein